MKPILAILLLIAASVAYPQAQTGAQTTTPAPAQIPEDDSSRKAHAIIDQAIAALGGPAYLNLTSKFEQGRSFSFYHGRSSSGGIRFANFTKYPDKQRFEVLSNKDYHFLIFDVGGVEAKDKSDIVIIHNGDKGYEITYKGTAFEDPLDTAAFLRRREHSLEAVLRRWLREPGTALFYDGVNATDGKPALKITVMNAHNDAVVLYLDQTTYLPIKKTFTWRDPNDKVRNLEEESYDGYKPVQGIMTPHAVTRYYNGDMSNQRLLNAVSYGQEMPDAFFQASATYNPKAPLKR